MFIVQIGNFDAVFAHRTKKTIAYPYIMADVWYEYTLRARRAEGRASQMRSSLRRQIAWLGDQLDAHREDMWASLKKDSLNRRASEEQPIALVFMSSTVADSQKFVRDEV